jgi:chaperonin GroES
LNRPRAQVRIKQAAQHPLDIRRSARKPYYGSISPVKVVPLGDHVVIRRIEASRQTPSGIVLPSEANDVTQYGRVLSVGDGRRLPDGTCAPHQVREGDRVLFAGYAGIEVPFNGERLLIMCEDEILAVVP